MTKLVPSLTFVLLIGVPAFAMNPKPIKSCLTVISMPGEPQTVDTLVEVFEQNGVYSAKVTQTSNGQTSSYTDEVTISDSEVRPGLKGEDKSENLNLAEKLVSHAMSLTEDPDFQGGFKVGLDLHKVRSAKVYLVGKVTNMGASAIVEANDDAGKNLGSYFGGFLVSPCK